MGTSFILADFSLNCGKWARRACVAKQASSQHSSAWRGTADCANKTVRSGSTPLANKYAVRSSVFSCTLIGSYKIK